MKYSYVVTYCVDAICRSPFRTAGINGEASFIQLRHDGVPILQGSGIAGALRNWMVETLDESFATTFFGSQEHSGCLIVSDMIFQCADIQTRPRIRMDYKTGTAMKHAKFDVAHIGKDTKGTFMLTWLGSRETVAQTEYIEQMLSAIQRGFIRFGAQKTNGFGQFDISVQCCHQDLTVKEQREAYLKDQYDWADCKLPEITESNMVTFIIQGTIPQILVKSGTPELRKTGSVATNLSENGEYFLPASSVKGVLRNQVQQIADFMKIPAIYVEDLFGRESNDTDLGQCGQVFVSDVKLSSDQKQKITRIRIDQFTGGVIRGGLFSEEPLCSEIEIQIYVPVKNKVGCGLLLYALRDTVLGLCTFGSGAAIGRGQLQHGKIYVILPEGEHIPLQQYTISHPFFMQCLQSVEEVRGDLL